jgi:hypothetical protein
VVATPMHGASLGGRADVSGGYVATGRPPSRPGHQRPPPLGGGSQAPAAVQRRTTHGRHPPAGAHPPAVAPAPGAVIGVAEAHRVRPAAAPAGGPVAAGHHGFGVAAVPSSSAGVALSNRIRGRLRAVAPTPSRRRHFVAIDAKRLRLDNLQVRQPAVVEFGERPPPEDRNETTHKQQHFTAPET